jgi:NADH:quinone reductase (non-electrogenic)
MSGPRADAPHVVVLGGGYVTLYVCRALRRAVRSGRVRLTVMSEENFLAFHGFIGEMLTGRISPSHLLSPARRIFRPAALHLGQIERVDLERRSITVTRRDDGRRSEIDYDQLVIACGTRDNLEAYPGLAEHAFRLKAFRDDLRLRNHILTMFEQAGAEPLEDERRRLLTFFVAGGGFAGTEVAGELADFARRLTAREYSHLRFEDCRFVLVEPGDSILPELYGVDGSGKDAHPRLIERARGRMDELGVEVRTGVRVEAVTPNEVRLSSGEHVPTRTVISAVGMKPQPIVAALAAEKDSIGRIVTDELLRVAGHPEVWAGGDCAAVPKPGGGTCPPVAIYAMKHGARIGRNIDRVLRGHDPKPFRWGGLGQAASVGNRYAIGELKGIALPAGLLSWVVWRGFLFRYFPSWEGRLRLLADWIIWPLVGRNIGEVPSGAAGAYDIRQNVFQPGEVIVQERVAGRYIHVILEGEVEICSDPELDGEPELLTVLGPGDHFGQRWLESFDPELARARTLVRTIALSRDQAPRLQEALVSTGRMVRESGHWPALDQPPPAHRP